MSVGEALGKCIRFVISVTKDHDFIVKVHKEFDEIADLLNKNQITDINVRSTVLIAVYLRNFKDTIVPDMFTKYCEKDLGGFKTDLYELLNQDSMDRFQKMIVDKYGSLSYDSEPESVVQGPPGITGATSPYDMTTLKN